LSERVRSRWRRTCCLALGRSWRGARAWKTGWESTRESNAVALIYTVAYRLHPDASLRMAFIAMEQEPKRV
jgi:hypothetical protein